jgi:small-conductance mechanosensitive channel
VEQFFQFNIGQIAQVVIVLAGVAVMFQKVRDDIHNQGARLANVETELTEVRKIIITVARQDERMNAMDQRMMAQGTRIDSTATILNGRLEAINNIVSGHTSQLASYRGRSE